MRNAAIRSTVQVFALFFAAIVAESGCSAKGVVTPDPPPIPTYTIVIDEAFSLDEQAAIARGADVWAAAVGRDLTFGYLVTPRTVIDAALERAPKAATLYFIRLGTSSEIPSCLVQAAPVACYHEQRAWLAAADMFTLNAWAKVPAHEVGHFLGLPHSTQNSVMQPEILDMAFEPTSSDVAAYCQYHSCKNYVPYPSK